MQSPLDDLEGVVTVTITSNGAAVDAAIAVLSVSVHKGVNEIPRATIVVRDGDIAAWRAFAVSEAEVFAPGAEVTISAGYGGKTRSIFQGVVVRQRITITGDNASRLAIECSDKAIAMTAGRRNALYAGQTDSDILAGIVSRYPSLTAGIAESLPRHSELVQYDCSDWDFALARAAAVGHLTIVEDGKFSSAPPETSASPVLKVTYGTDLIEFEGEIDASTQGADTKATQAMSVLRRVHGRMKFQGSALAKVGALIRLGGLGARFDSDVFVSEVQHEIAEGNWITAATFGLAPPRRAEREIVAPRASEASPGLGGLQMGVVTGLDDPAGEGRVQVSLPLLQAGSNSLWARRASLYASSGAGTFFMPEIGDEVLVAFLHGDLRDPLILGSLWSSAHKPPYAAAAANNTKAIVTRSLARIEFDDAMKIITIETPAKNRVVVSDAGKSILVEDQNDNKVALSPSGIVMDSPKDIRISAKGGVTIDAVGPIAMTSKADVKMNGLNVRCDAQVGFSAKGSATAELSAAGQTTVRGAMVMIN